MGKKSREKREKVNEAHPISYSPNSTMEKVCLYVIRWGAYLAMFTPLIINQNFFYPYVVPKTIFFRIIVDVILIAYILLVTVNRSYRPRMNWLSWGVLGFLVVSFVAAILGEDFVKSFWSSFERMTGLLTFVHLYAFFLILSSVFKERKHWEKIMTVSILVGMILAFQVYTSDNPTTRGGGGLGNTSFMSAYIIFNIFFAIILFFTKNKMGKIFYGVTLVTMLFLLFRPPEQPTQGAIGAFIGGIALLLFLYFALRLLISGGAKAKKIVVASIIVLVLAAAAIVQTSFFKNKINEISQSSSWQARQIVWTMSYKMWQERPWFGWGEDNFSNPFTKYYEPALPLTNDMWYDRAHNIVLDVMVSSGIVGLVSYLSIFVISVITLLKLSFRLADKKDLIIPAGMIALLAVYFFQNLWVFDMVASYMMFFMTLSFVYFLTKEKKEEAEETSPAKRPYAFIPVLLIALTLVGIYFGNIKPALASSYIIKAKYSSLEESIKIFEKSVEASPVALSEGAEQFTTSLSEMVFDQDVDKNVLLQGFYSAEEIMKKALLASPNNFRLKLILGKFYNSFSNVGNTQQMLDLAREALEEARDMSPKNQQVYWELSQNELYRGNKDKSVEYMQKAIDLEPKFSVSYWYMSLIYRVMGDYEEAWEYMQEAREKGYKWNNSLSDLTKVISVNQMLENHEELIYMYDAALKMDPKNAKLAGGMAVSLANLGATKEAVEMAKLAVELDSSLREDLQSIIDLGQ